MSTPRSGHALLPFGTGRAAAIGGRVDNDTCALAKKIN